MDLLKIRAIFSLSSVSALNVAGLALLSILLAKFLSVNDFGITRTVTSYMILLTMFGHITFQDALASKVARANEYDVKCAYFTTATIFVFLNSILIGLLSYFIIMYSGYWDGELRNVLSVMVPFLPLVTLSILHNNSLQALGGYRSLMLVLLAAAIVPLLVILPLAFYFQLDGWLIGRLLSFLILAVISIYVVKQYLTPFRFRYREFNKLLLFSRVQVISGFLSLVLLSADIILIERLLRDLESVAYYGMAAFFVKAVMFIPTSISRIYFKSIAENSAGITKDNKIFEFLSVVVIVCGIVAICMYLIGPVFIKFIFGTQYDKSIEILHILSLGIVFMGLWQAISTINVSISRPKYSVLISLTGAIIGIILLVTLIPVYGISGAAWSMNVAYFSGVIVGLYLLSINIKKV